MFHVKHSADKSPKSDPVEIGTAVRGLITPLLLENGLDNPELPLRLDRFAATLALWGAKTNLTAHPDDPAETAFHIVDSLAPVAMRVSGNAPHLQRYFEPGQLILDIGSGAGFPGLIIAAATATFMTLSEPRRKRASFLEAAATAMNLDNVELSRLRAADMKHGEGFDVVTARGVRPDSDLFKAAAGLLRLGGILMFYASVQQEFDLESASRVGLEEPIASPYDLWRGGVKQPRALMAWIRH
jgi:16S rRNA (guanine527-N7)-methyltransferase